MRTLAMIGAGAIAALISVTGAFAWTQEQPAKSGGGGANAVDLSDNDAFQALQDKVNGKAPSSQSGFQVYGGVDAGSATADSPVPIHTACRPCAAGHRLSATRRTRASGGRATSSRSGAPGALAVQRLNADHLVAAADVLDRGE